MSQEGQRKGGKKAGQKTNKPGARQAPASGAGKGARGANVTFDDDDYGEEDVFDEEDYGTNATDVDGIRYIGKDAWRFADTKSHFPGHDNWVVEHVVEPEGEPQQTPPDLRSMQWQALVDAASGPPDVQ